MKSKRVSKHSTCDCIGLFIGIVTGIALLALLVIVPYWRGQESGREEVRNHIEKAVDSFNFCEHKADVNYDKDKLLDKAMAQLSYYKSNTDCGNNLSYDFKDDNQFQ